MEFVWCRNCETIVPISRELDIFSLTATWECKSNCVPFLFQFLREAAWLPNFLADGVEQSTVLLITSHIEKKLCHMASLT